MVWYVNQIVPVISLQAQMEFVAADRRSLFAYALKIAPSIGYSKDEDNSMPTRAVRLLIVQTNSINKPIKATLTKLTLGAQTLTPNHTTIIRANDDPSIYQSDVFQVSTLPRSEISEIEVEYGPIDEPPIKRLTRRDRIQWPIQIGPNQTVNEVDKKEEDINDQHHK